MLMAGSGRWWLSQRLPSCQLGPQIILWRMELAVQLLLSSSRCKFLGGTFSKLALWIYFDLPTACTTNPSPLQVKGSSHRDLLVHFNGMEGNRNLEKDCSGKKVPWTELPEPRDLFICITGWNFQFLSRITGALTRKSANLPLYISIHIHCISCLGKRKTPPNIYLS